MSGPQDVRPGSPQVWKTGTGAVIALSLARCYGGRVWVGGTVPLAARLPGEAQSVQPPRPTAPPRGREPRAALSRRGWERTSHSERERSRRERPVPTGSAQSCCSILGKRDREPAEKRRLGSRERPSASNWTPTT